MDASIALAKKLLVLTADGTSPDIDAGYRREPSALEQLPQYVASVGPSAQLVLDGLLEAFASLPQVDPQVACRRGDPPPHTLAQLLMRLELDPAGSQAWKPPVVSLGASILAKHVKQVIAARPHCNVAWVEACARERGLWLRFETAAVAVALLRAGEVGPGHRASALLQAEISAAIGQWVPRAVPRLVDTNNRSTTGTEATQSRHLGTTTALRLLAKQLRALAFLALYGPFEASMRATTEVQEGEGAARSITHNGGSGNRAHNGTIGSAQPYLTEPSSSTVNPSGAVAALELLPIIVSAAENLPPHRGGAPPLHVEVQRALLRTAGMLKGERSFQGEKDGNGAVAMTDADCDSGVDNDTYDESDWFCGGVWTARDIQRAPHPAPAAALLTCALELAAVPAMLSPPIRARNAWNSECQDDVRWRAGHWLKLAQRIHAQILPENSRTCRSDTFDSDDHNSQYKTSSRTIGNLGVISGNDVPALARLCVLAAVRANNAPASLAARISDDSDNNEDREHSGVGIAVATNGNSACSDQPADEGLGRAYSKCEDNNDDEVAGTTGAAASAAWLSLVASLLRNDLSNSFGLNGNFSPVNYTLSGAQEAHRMASSSGGTLEVILEQLLPSVPVVALGLARHVRKSLAHTVTSYFASIKPSGRIASEPRTDVQSSSRRKVSSQLAPSSFITYADVSLVLLLLRGTAPLAGALASLQRQTMGAASPSEISFGAPLSISSTSSSSSSSSHALSAPVLALLPPALDGSPALLQLLLATLLNAPNIHGQSREEGDTSIARAARVVWQVLTLNGSEASSSNGSSSSSGSSHGGSGGVTSPRKAAVAGQLADAALAWAVDDPLGAAVGGGNTEVGSRSNNGGGSGPLALVSSLWLPPAHASAAAVTASKGQEHHDMSAVVNACRVAALAWATPGTGRAVLNSVALQCPEARAWLVDALGGGALAPGAGLQRQLRHARALRSVASALVRHECYSNSSSWSSATGAADPVEMSTRDQGPYSNGSSGSSNSNAGSSSVSVLAGRLGHGLVPQLPLLTEASAAAVIASLAPLRYVPTLAVPLLALARKTSAAHTGEGRRLALRVLRLLLRREQLPCSSLETNHRTAVAANEEAGDDAICWRPLSDAAMRRQRRGALRVCAFVLSLGPGARADLIRLLVLDDYGEQHNSGRGQYSTNKDDVANGTAVMPHTRRCPSVSDALSPRAALQLQKSLRSRVIAYLVPDGNSNLHLPSENGSSSAANPVAVAFAPLRAIEQLSAPVIETEGGSLTSKDDGIGSSSSSSSSSSSGKNSNVARFALRDGGEFALLLRACWRLAAREQTLKALDVLQELISNAGDLQGSAPLRIISQEAAKNAAASQSYNGLGNNAEMGVDEDDDDDDKKESHRNGWWAGSVETVATGALLGWLAAGSPANASSTRGSTTGRDSTGVFLKDGVNTDKDDDLASESDGDVTDDDDDVNVGAGIGLNRLGVADRVGLYSSDNPYNGSIKSSKAAGMRDLEWLRCKVWSNAPHEIFSGESTAGRNNSFAGNLQESFGGGVDMTAADAHLHGSGSLSECSTRPPDSSRLALVASTSATLLDTLLSTVDAAIPWLGVAPDTNSVNGAIPAITADFSANKLLLAARESLRIRAAATELHATALRKEAEEIAIAAVTEGARRSPEKNSGGPSLLSLPPLTLSRAAGRGLLHVLVTALDEDAATTRGAGAASEIGSSGGSTDASHNKRSSGISQEWLGQWEVLLLADAAANAVLMPMDEVTQAEAWGSENPPPEYATATSNSFDNVGGGGNKVSFKESKQSNSSSSGSMPPCASDSLALLLRVWLHLSHHLLASSQVDSSANPEMDEKTANNSSKGKSGAPTAAAQAPASSQADETSGLAAQWFANAPGRWRRYLETSNPWLDASTAAATGPAQAPSTATAAKDRRSSGNSSTHNDESSGSGCYQVLKRWSNWAGPIDAEDAAWNLEAKLLEALAAVPTCAAMPSSTSDGSASSSSSNKTGKLGDTGKSAGSVVPSALPGLTALAQAWSVHGARRLMSSINIASESNLGAANGAVPEATAAEAAGAAAATGASARGKSKKPKKRLAPELVSPIVQPSSLSSSSSSSSSSPFSSSSSSSSSTSSLPTFPSTQATSRPTAPYFEPPYPHPAYLAASLGSLSSCIAKRLSACLEGRGLPLRNAHAYATAIQSFSDAAATFEDASELRAACLPWRTDTSASTNAPALALSIRKKSGTVAPTEAASTTTATTPAGAPLTKHLQSDWRRTAALALVAPLCRADVTHTSVVRRLVNLALHLAVPIDFTSKPAVSAMSVTSSGRANSSNGGGSNDTSRDVGSTTPGNNNAYNSGHETNCLSLSYGKKSNVPSALLSALFDACVQRLARWDASTAAPDSKMKHPPAAADARSWAASAEEWVLASDLTAAIDLAMAAATESTQKKGRTNNDDIGDANEDDGSEGANSGGSAAARVRLAKEQAAARANGMLLALEHSRKQSSSNSNYSLGAAAQSRRSGGAVSSDDSSEDHEKDSNDSETEPTMNARLHRDSAFNGEDLIRGRIRAWERFCSRIDCPRERWPAAVELVPRAVADAAVTAAAAAATPVTATGAQSIESEPATSSDGANSASLATNVTNTLYDRGKAETNEDLVAMPLALPSPAVWIAAIAVCLAHTESLFAAFAAPNRSSPSSLRQASYLNFSSSNTTSDAVAAASGATAGLALIEAWHNLLHPLRCLCLNSARKQASKIHASAMDKSAPIDASINPDLEPLAALLPPALKARLVACFARLTAAVRTVALRLQRSTISHRGGGDIGTVSRSIGMPLNYPAAESMALLVALLETAVSTMSTNDSSKICSSETNSNLMTDELDARNGLKSDSNSEREDSSDDTNGRQVGLAHKKYRGEDHGNASKRQRNSAAFNNGKQPTGEKEALQEQSPKAASDVRFWSTWLTELRGGSTGNSDSSGIVARRATEVLMDGDLLIYDLHNLRMASVSRSARNDAMPVSEDDNDEDFSGIDSSSEATGETATLLWLDARLQAALNAFVLANSGSHFDSSNKEIAWGDQAGAPAAQWTNPLAEGALGRKRGRSSRLRSRNRVIDQWLEDEDGRDAYADLEGFIVD